MLKDKLNVIQEKSTEGIWEKGLDLINEKYENLIKTNLSVAQETETIHKNERKIETGLKHVTKGSAGIV